MFPCGVKDCDLDRILSYPRGRNSRSLASYIRALVMSRRDCFILARLVFSEVKIMIAACLESCVVNIKCTCSD